jgi:ABC-type antimicrobial peptide transport system permease subunit
MSYSVTRRTSEIGIRMALGASRGNVVGMVLREAFTVVAIGLAIGLPTALAVGRLISNRLYGLSASDPAAIASTSVLILTTAVLAGYIPARRASRIDPLVSLRHE